MLPELDKLLSDKRVKILFAGIGNVLKSDDGAGVYICKKIRNSSRIKALCVEVSIENYIGKINKLKPDILILIDSLDIDSPAGTCKFLHTEKIRDMTFNTHNISLNKLKDFFEMPTYILGIQPERIDFGENLSYIVKEVSDQIINLINKQEVNHGY